MKLPISGVHWNHKLRFDDKRKLALIASARKFQNCTTELDGTRYAILDSNKVRRGWVRYDIEEFDLCEARCVLVGSKTTLIAKKSFMLVVRRTSVEGEYKRVGLGMIHKSFVKEEAVDMRIV